MFRRSVGALLILSLLTPAFAPLARADDEPEAPSSEIGQGERDASYPTEIQKFARLDEIVSDSFQVAIALEDHLQAIEPQVRRKEFMKLANKGKVTGQYTAEMNDYARGLILPLGRERLAWLVENIGVDEAGEVDSYAKKIAWSAREGDVAKAAASLRRGEWDGERRAARRMAKLGRIALQKLILSGKDPKLDEWAQRIGDRALIDTVIRGDKEGLEVRIPGLGRGEATSLDQKLVRRVIHEKTGKAVFFLPDDLDLDSRHLDQLFARTNLVAGDNGEGRDAIAVQMGEVVREDLKPQSFKERAQKTWKAVWAGHPDRSMLAMGAIFSSAQVAISGGIGLLQSAQAGYSGWERVTHVSPLPMVLSAVFGMAVGSYLPTWKNFANLPSVKDPHGKIKRAAYNATLSVLFAETLIGLGPQGSSLLTIVTQLGIAGNVWANNFVRDFTNEFNRVREEKGLSRGKIGPFKQSHLEYQTVNLGQYTLKMFDFLPVYVPLSLFGMGVALPIGKLLFYSSALWAQYLVLRYAEAINAESAPKLRQQWEDFIRLGPLKRVPSHLYAALAWALGSGTGAALGAKELCLRALSPQEEDVPDKAPTQRK